MSQLTHSDTLSSIHKLGTLSGHTAHALDSVYPILLGTLVALSDTKIKQAKPRSKRYKLYDAKGLYILVSPKGDKWWRLRYQFRGKEAHLSLGVYPAVSLKKARKRQLEVFEQLAESIDPAAAKAAKKQADANTFEALAREFIENNRPKWKGNTYEVKLSRMERHLFPYIGQTPVRELTPPQLLEVLRRIEDAGAKELPARMRSLVGQILRYGIATGRAERDIAADLQGALKPHRARHHPSITEPKAVGALLRAIDGYEGHLVIKTALQLAPLVFVRPGELRGAQWSEFDFDAAQWHVPAERMKVKQKHIVPLSKQVIALLEGLKQLTGGERFVFPGVRTSDRPISDNTINAALRKLGYTKDEMTGHGFRSTASTLLNESQKWHVDAIERQLAHGERNDIRAAYNYAEHLDERTKMMQWWADYLDRLRDGAEIIPIRKQS